MKLKKRRDRLIGLAQSHSDWVVGFQDEVWFSRLAQPRLHSWTLAEGLRLHQKEKPKTKKKNQKNQKNQKKKKDEKNEKNEQEEALALACYGVLLAASETHSGEMHLRFVNGRPISSVTTQYLEWLTQQLARQGQRVLVLVWDNARWHTSQEVRQWIKAHNRQVKAKNALSGAKPKGCRILVCALPVKSPWLNPIEPKWVHGKRNIVEPERILSPLEIQQRLCSYYQCPLLKPLDQWPTQQ